jgi:hypothetical protein
MTTISITARALEIPSLRSFLLAPGTTVLKIFGPELVTFVVGAPEDL